MVEISFMSYCKSRKASERRVALQIVSITFFEFNLVILEEVDVGLRQDVSIESVKKLKKGSSIGKSIT